MFDRLSELADEHAALERQLADPAVHADPDQARSLGRRYSELTPIITAFREWQQAAGDEQAARELAREDSSFAAEAEQLGERRAALEDQLQALLAPRDPNDAKDVILEVKAGEGGEESALFAGDLLRMYLRYAERQRWQTEILDATMTGLGGYKDATVAVKAARAAAVTGGVWSKLKYEGGVHRVQRVPVTESQGRIHTSAAGVLVMPEADPVEVSIDPNDLRIDVFRSSGPGGQSVNTTDSAVRITHKPTGIVVSCQNEKSQLQNREQALRILRARLLAQAQADADAQAAAQRQSQVRTVDRSQRVRTYNFPENRVSDHRVGYKAHNLDQVLDGDLDAVIAALTEADRAGAGQPVAQASS
ncbi:MAG: peptide chain release factor 1 [Nocardiopsaceae bacterium]|jgi:peptide chain release factor 1|nr:peptide chain release factor 1 [Nocardiopsaceae bacterium]